MEAITEKRVRTYERYKDSGVEWLGEIPEHWEMKSFKFLAQANKGKLPQKIVSTNEVELPPYMSMEYLRGGVENQWVFDKDALIIDSDEILLLWDGSNSGEFLKSREGVISSTVAHIIFKGIDKNFAWYHCKVLELELRKNTIGMGIPHVNGRVLNNSAILLPPLPEQTAIANFLDDKTQKIDQAICIKEQQIALLKERKQILVHQAVTGQWTMDNGKWLMTPKEKMKDSGVDWIGEIPQHWEVKPLRYVGKTQNGLSKGGEYFGSGYPFLTYGDVYKDIVVPDKLSGLAESTEEDRKQFSVVGGDVFFTRTSETVEEIGFSSTCMKTIENATFAGFLIRFRPVEGILYKGFSRYYFSSSTHRPFFVGKMNLVIRASLSQELLKSMPVLIPPLSEQREISSYIESSSQKINTAISLKTQEIEKLKEYKSSLINSVVTGKVKVCD